MSAEQRATLERLCERAIEAVGDRAAAQATAVTVTHGLTRFANSGIHQHVGEDVTTLHLKVEVERRVATVETTRLDDDGLTALAQRALDAAALLPEDPHWAGLTPPTDVHDVDHDDEDTRAAGPDVRAEQVRAFVDAGPGLRAAGFVDAQALTAATVNSLGHRASGSATRATVDGIHQTDSSAGKAHQTSQRLGDIDGAAAGRTAARLAEASADAGDLEPGTYRVVLSPECVATMLTFLAFYGFNAKNHLEGQSFVQLGEQQFDAAVSVWDDATDPRALGVPFDAEATPKRRVDLIDAGVSVSLTHDRRTAARAGTETTGHALPGGEAWGAMPENVFMAPGDASDEDLLAGLERGLLVTEFNYCRILDPKTQVVTGLTRNGTFLVEDGRIVRPVSNLRFTQSFLGAFAPGQIEAIGSDARFADAEFGPGLVHAPAVRLAEWRFTGGARG